ncbi:CLUMA_CG019890, isoform A [Clunio marinus]|uniref:CLUMA_CG019890, isoform A n=1 Tax=Clunio marinus TaxID=568069 RepID=A0A1J1J3E0_9DIPT|nr:CLUMA_CG019890, isoform A [Clunio marinus]
MLSVKREREVQKQRYKDKRHGKRGKFLCNFSQCQNTYDKDFSRKCEENPRDVQGGFEIISVKRERIRMRRR